MAGVIGKAVGLEDRVLQVGGNDGEVFRIEGEQFQAVHGASFGGKPARERKAPSQAALRKMLGDAAVCGIPVFSTR
ncbi:hypothetical protein GCM10023069_68590 [Shinella granuli]